MIKKLILLNIIINCYIYSLIAENLYLLPKNDARAALEFVKPYLPLNPIIVEAGAFDGTDTINMHKFWPAAKIYTFEPLPEIYNLLVEKTKIFKNIFTYNYALSNITGNAKFYISKTPEGDLYGSSSLLPAKEHVNYFPFNFKEEIIVPTITLDDWAQQNNINSIDFLWLDMQGYELPTLMASPKILKTIKVIYTEAIFIEAYKGQPLYDDIKIWLENNGFKMIARDLSNPSREKDFWYCNCVFIKNKNEKNEI